MGKRSQEKMIGFTKQERVKVAIEREVKQQRKREEARLKFLEASLGIKIKRRK